MGVNVAALLAWWGAATMAALGLRRMVHDRALDPWVPALLAWAALAASGLLLAAHTRYRVPSDPIVLLLAAAWLTRRAAQPPQPASALGRATTSGSPAALPR